MSKPRADRNTTKLGFIGLGIMGRPMVARLLERGWQVTVWNLEPEMTEDAVRAGAVRAESPAAVREASDIVLMCVLNDKAVADCCFKDDGLARAQGGADLLVDCSTMNPDSAVALAGRLQAEAGMAWLDAPISGGPGAAREGALTLMVGGDEAQVDRAAPIFEDLAANVTWVGPVGSGQTVKVINQAIVGTNYVLMGEIVTLARRAGIDPARIPACLKGGMADSTVLQRVYPQMAEEDFDPPRAYARQLNKDLQNLHKYVGGLGLDLPVIEEAVRRYAAYVAEGNEMADAASISRLYARQLAGRR